MTTYVSTSFTGNPGTTVPSPYGDFDNSPSNTTFYSPGAPGFGTCGRTDKTGGAGTVMYRVDTGGTATVYADFLWRVDTADDYGLVEVTDTGDGFVICGVRITSAGAILLRSGDEWTAAASTTDTASTTFSTNQWYRFVFTCDTGAGTTALDIYTNPSNFAPTESMGGTCPTADAAGWVTLGTGGAPGDTYAGYAYMDNIVISDADVTPAIPDTGLEALGLMFIVNGSEIDDSVDYDGVPWVEKVGKVSISQGGGSWTRASQPAVCQFDMLVSIAHAPRVRTITVGMAAIGTPGNGTTVTPDDHDPIVGTGAGAYRTVFHGDVQSVRAFDVDIYPGDPHPIQFDAVSDLASLLNRRARCAADTDSGIRELLDDIETAHGLTMTGNDWFATIANGFPTCDRPKQKRVTNGAYIATMLAPTGTSVTDDWDGTILAPTLRWRADHSDSDYLTTSPSAKRGLEIGYPWKCTHDDSGYAYEDYVAKYHVTGEDSAGAQYYGWARLSNLYGERSAVQNREVSIDSYIDNAADCKAWAKRLLAYQGSAGYGLRMNAVTINLEVYYQALVAGGSYFDPTDPDASMEILYLGTMMPGDELYARGTTYTDTWGDSNSDYGDWPADLDDSIGLGENLYSLWNPLIGKVYGNGYQIADVHTIRQVRRTFDPASGWTVTFSLLPWSTDIRGSDVDAADADQGTD